MQKSFTQLEQFVVLYGDYLIYFPLVSVPRTESCNAMFRVLFKNHSAVTV